MNISSRNTLAQILVLVFTLTIVPSAWSATYYIRSDGSDTNNGLSNTASGAWRTLTKANNALRAGDIVQVMSLNPLDTLSSTTNAINPTANGTGLAGGAGRITYVGNVTAPQNLPVPKIDITRSYVTVRGFRAKNGAYISYDGNSGELGDFTVIERCLVYGTSSFCGCHDSRISDNVMYLDPSSWSSFSIAGCEECSQTPYRTSIRDTLLNNVINMGVLNGTSYGLYVKNFSNNNLIKGNKFSAMLDAQGVVSDVQLIALQASYRNTYQDNKWTVEINSDPLSNGRWFISTIRNGTHDNLFERESILVDMQPPHFYSRIMLGQISSPICPTPMPAEGAEYNCSRNPNRNTFKECYFKTPSAEIFFQSTADSVTVKNSVFVSKNFPAVNLNAGANNATFEHNTFFSEGSEAFTHFSGSLTGTNRLTGNMFLSNSVANCSQPTQRWNSTTGMVQDQNLFYGWSGPSSAAVGAGSSCYSVGPTSSWNTTHHHDANSRWGDPLLANRTFTAFNPSLLAGSPAIATVFPGGYAGAIAPFDATAPGTVTNLSPVQIGDKSVILVWTAPGDDGSVGAAVAYDLRWSQSPINAGNFASATPMGVQPNPAASGAPQEYVVTGLSAATTYYFAIKARDDAGNWSAISNVSAATTTTTDVLRPAGVTDLGTSP